MQSGQVNASQLMASFLGSENEKIGHALAQTDFEGELKKLLPPPANSAVPSALNTQAKSGVLNSLEQGAQAGSSNLLDKQSGAIPRSGELGRSAGGPAGVFTLTTPDKSCQAPSSRRLKGEVGSSTKIKEIKSKAQTEQSLFITNPAIVETVLADLKCPAEAIKSCKGLQNKEGRISFKDLKSLLDTQPTTGSQTSAQIPADHVRALIESIIAKQSGTNQEVLAYAGNLKPQVQVKTEGTYSPAEFRGLLEKVLKESDGTRKQLASLGSQLGSAETSKPAEGPKAGQTESLAANVLPSFVNADRQNDLTGKILTAVSNNVKPEAQGPKVRDVRESSIEAVSDDSTSGGRQSIDGIALKAEGSKGTAPGMDAGVKDGGSGSVPGPTASSVPQEKVSINNEALDSILKYFDAKIVSVSPQQSEVKDAGAHVPGGLDEGVVAQGQNFAQQVKGAEKQADKSREVSGSSTPSRDIAEQSDAARITTASAEHPSDQSSADSTPNQAADPAQKTPDHATSAKLDLDQLRAQFREILRGAESDGVLEVPAQSKLSNSIEGIVKKAALPSAVLSTNPIQNNNAGASAAVDAAEIAAQLGQDIKGESAKPASAVESVDSIKASGNTGDQSESTGPSSKFDYTIENLLSGGELYASGEGAASGQSLQYSASPANATAAVNAVENHAASRGQDTVLFAGHIEKQLGSRDSAPESAVFQNSASSLQKHEINLPRMDNPDQNGFSNYDPYRSAELVHEMRERLAGVPGNQLVLEMEPDGLGKINIKVGARKDEISVVAMTQSEPARQTLMRHSPELRQDLQDQGLSLGKFMVDVNGEKSGGANYHETNDAGSKTTPPSKIAKVHSAQPSDIPAYVSRADDRSQISIFA